MPILTSSFKHPRFHRSLRRFSFLSVPARRAGWLTAAPPGAPLTGQSETSTLAAAYSLATAMYARHRALNAVFDRQSLSLDGSYRARPRVTLTLTDSYIASVNTNLVSPSGVATGRSRAWSNTVTPGVGWQVTPLTTLRLAGIYVAQRYEQSALDDSDVYRP